MGRLIISKQLEKPTGIGFIPHTDANGDLQFVAASSIVANNETVTTITDNADGTFDYDDENGGSTTVSIPYVAQLSKIENGVADTLEAMVFVVPPILDGKDITRFSAFFAQGSGTHTVSLRKNASTIASVTSLTAPGGGNVAVVGETVSTGDRLSIIFTTTVTGFGLCYGTATIV